MLKNKGANKAGTEHLKVFVRIRPGHEGKSTLTVLKKRELLVTTPSYNRRFIFDHVFGMESSQKEIYELVVAPMIPDVLNGYSCTVFAYGQTGTGKTYTMHGPLSHESSQSAVADEKSGIIARAVKHIFDKLLTMNESHVVSVSFLELYNEEIFDLLATDGTGSERKLRLYEDKKSASVIVQDLKEILIRNPCDVFKLLCEGSTRRQTAQTLLNASSSRSHSLFTVTIQMREGSDFKKVGKLNIVDLAGSENIKQSGVFDKGAREASNINKSLLTLGRVMTALADSASHIPYRESKLTRILQDSLNGHAKTSIIATVSTTIANVDETLNTLEYANRARSISIHPEINHRLPIQTLMKELQDKLHEKDALLQRIIQEKGAYLSAERYQQLMELEESITKMPEMQERIDLLLSKVAEDETERARLKEELTTLREENEHSKAENEQLLERCEKEHANLANLKTAFEAIKAEHVAERAQLTSKIETYRQSIQKIEDEKQADKQEILKITNVSRILRTRLDNVYNTSNTNLRTLEGSTRYFESKYTQLLKTVTASNERTNETLRTHKDTVRNEIEHMREYATQMFGELAEESAASTRQLIDTVLHLVRDESERDATLAATNFCANTLTPFANSIAAQWHRVADMMCDSFQCLQETARMQLESIEAIKENSRAFASQISRLHETYRSQILPQIERTFVELDDEMVRIRESAGLKRRKIECLVSAQTDQFDTLSSRFAHEFERHFDFLQQSNSKILRTSADVSNNLNDNQNIDASVDEFKTKLDNFTIMQKIEAGFAESVADTVADHVTTFDSQIKQKLVEKESSFAGVIDSMAAAVDSQQAVIDDLQSFQSQQLGEQVNDEVTPTSNIISPSDSNSGPTQNWKNLRVTPTGLTPDKKLIQDMIEKIAQNKEN